MQVSRVAEGFLKKIASRGLLLLLLAVQFIRPTSLVFSSRVARKKLELVPGLGFGGVPATRTQLLLGLPDSFLRPTRSKNSRVRVNPDWAGVCRTAAGVQGFRFWSSGFQFLEL